MDTLHDRLAELADDAPTGGVPAAELWARGKRAHRFRAAGLGAALLVVGAVGAGVGVGLADGDGDGSDVEPAGTVGFSLPIEYPVGEELPDLGYSPGPLAAIWGAPRVGGGAREAVGLVAETGTFGTLPIDFLDSPDGPSFVDVAALSPDGRRIAYLNSKRDADGRRQTELIVRDLVSGENYSPVSGLKTRGGFKWVDATHLLGHVAAGTDADGWLWEPGTAPTLVNIYLVPYGGTDLSVPIQGLGPRDCSSPTLQNVETMQKSGGVSWEGSFQVPVLCDILGIVPGSEILLGHWNDPNDGNGTVVALDIRGVPTPPPGPHAADSRFEDPALRRVVATAGAPLEVEFASDLIGEALDADGGAS